MCMSASYAGAPWSGSLSGELIGAERLLVSARPAKACARRTRCWGFARLVVVAIARPRDERQVDFVSSAAASSGPAATRVSAEPSSRSRLGGDGRERGEPARGAVWGTSRPRRSRFPPRRIEPRGPIAAIDVYPQDRVAEPVAGVGG